jgi:predicted ribosome quality control (RQC) complex YloA/Tae2 family protein
MELSGVDLHYAAQELQLQGAKVEKIYQGSSKKDVLFTLYLRDVPKIHLRFLPGLVYTTKEKPAYPQTPPGFAMFLRKHLGGARIKEVRQRGFDRILEIDFETKAATTTLVIELIPPGNMLLLDTEGRIINLLEMQQFKDRQLRPRQPYVAPPAAFDVPRVSDEELVDRIVVSTRDSIVTALAMTLGLGGIYAEEALNRAGIAKQRNDLSVAEVKQVVAAVREVLSQPLAAHTDGKRVYPFRLQSREVTPCEETSFLAAMASVVPSEIIDVQAVKQRERAAPKNKLQTMIDAQRKQIAKFERDATVEQHKGERIYEEYLIFQEIVNAAREAREHKQDIAAALKRFPQVISYNGATGEVEVEVDE